MKFENNWRYRSLENLEKSIWPPVDNDESYLVTTCNQLRKKPLGYLSTEDLRIMIGQDIGLIYLIPLAIEVLTYNILAEGDLYEGDLLYSVLNASENYWREEEENWRSVYELYDLNRSLLECNKLSVSKSLFKAFSVFKRIHNNAASPD